jgi:hypothetical protein
MLIKPRSRRKAGHISRTREEKYAYKILVGEHQGRDHLEDRSVCVEGNIKMAVVQRYELYSSDPKGIQKHCDEAMASIKAGYLFPSL